MIAETIARLIQSSAEVNLLLLEKSNVHVEILEPPAEDSIVAESFVSVQQARK